MDKISRRNADRPVESGACREPWGCHDQHESTTTLIVGIGSSHGDDQIGFLVAEQLSLLDPHVCRVRRTNAPMRLLDWIDRFTTLHLIDACRSGDQPGTLRRYQWPDPQLLQCGWSGTHDFDLPTVLRLADQLDRLPACVSVWTIEGVTFGPGARASLAIETWTRQAAKQIESELLGKPQRSDEHEVTGCVPRSSTAGPSRSERADA